MKKHVCLSPSSNWVVSSVYADCFCVSAGDLLILLNVLLNEKTLPTTYYSELEPCLKVSTPKSCSYIKCIFAIFYKCMSSVILKHVCRIC